MFKKQNVGFILTREKISALPVQMACAVQVQAFYRLILHLYLTLFHPEPIILVESTICTVKLYSSFPYKYELNEISIY